MMLEKEAAVADVLRNSFLHIPAPQH